MHRGPFTDKFGSISEEFVRNFASEAVGDSGETEGVVRFAAARDKTVRKVSRQKRVPSRGVDDAVF